MTLDAWQPICAANCYPTIVFWAARRYDKQQEIQLLCSSNDLYREVMWIMNLLNIDADFESLRTI